MLNDHDRPSDGGRYRQGGGGYRNGGGRGPDEGYGGGGGDYDRGRRGVPLSELDPALTEVSRKLIGGAIDVHKALGPGYGQSVYLNALCKELDALGVGYKAQASFPVMHRGAKVGEAVADLFVADRFLVVVLADLREIGTQERTHLRALLRAADLELGLVVNFAERRLKDGLVRVLNPEKIKSLRPEGEDMHEDVPAGDDRA